MLLTPEQYLDLLVELCDLNKEEVIQKSRRIKLNVCIRSAIVKNMSDNGYSHKQIASLLNYDRTSCYHAKEIVEQIMFWDKMPIHTKKMKEEIEITKKILNINPIKDEKPIKIDFQNVNVYALPGLKK